MLNPQSIITIAAIYLAACASPVKTYRVRFPAINTDLIVYETEAQVSRQCSKHIRKWERATGLKHKLDDGRESTERTVYRGCTVPPLHEGLNQHILTSLETVDNFAHELCHALGADPSICDSIRFDGKSYPGKTVDIGE
mgnify:CR=1 FL=1